MHRSNLIMRNRCVIDRVTKESKLMLLNTKTAEIAVLNSTATLVWILIDGTRTLDEIIQVIRKEFPDTNIKVIERDILKLTRKLISNGFVHVVDRKLAI